MFSGVDVTVVLFINLRFVDVGLEVDVVVELLVSCLVIGKGVVVFFRWLIFSLSNSLLVVGERDVLKLEVVFGNFWPNLNFAVVPSDVEGAEVSISVLVVLGLDEVLDDVLAINVDDVVLVFWPKGINFEVIVLRVVCFGVSSRMLSFMEMVEDSANPVVFVLAPNGIPTELAMASGGLIFWKNKEWCIRYSVFIQ